MGYPEQIQILFESGDGDVPYIVAMTLCADEFSNHGYRCVMGQETTEPSDITAVKRALEKHHIPVLATYGKKNGNDYLHSIMVSGKENIESLMNLEFVQAARISDFA